MRKESVLCFVVPHDGLQVSGILVLGLVHGRERVTESVMERGDSGGGAEGLPSSGKGFRHQRILFRAEAPPKSEPGEIIAPPVPSVFSADLASRR